MSEATKTVHVGTDKRLRAMSPLWILLSAVGVLGASIGLWFLVFALGATLNSEQFRNLLNIASVQTVYDVTKPAPDGIKPVPPSSDSSTPGTQVAIRPTGATASSGSALLRSWRELADPDRRLTKGEDGKSETYNPERTEFVLAHFLGFSPGVWLVLLLAMTTYAPTNLALLSCLAGLAGAAALRLGCTLPTDEYGNLLYTKNGHAARFWMTMMRGLGTGFIVYLTGMAGTMIVSGQPFQVTGPEDYNRLVATISLSSFVLAVRPRLFFAVLASLHPGPRPGAQGEDEPAAGQEIELKPDGHTPAHSWSAYIDGVPVQVQAPRP